MCVVPVVDWLYGKAIVSDSCRRLHRNQACQVNNLRIRTKVDGRTGKATWVEDTAGGRREGFALTSDHYEGATLRWILGSVRRTLGARTH